jgi:cell division transport system ATP-binding protein
VRIEPVESDPALDHGPVLGEGEPMVAVQRLSHNFGSHWALKDVSFTLGKGEFLFLFGPTGAGKTTLLRILHAALPLTRGLAMVAGFDLRKLARADVPRLRRSVSVVFQDFKIMPERSVAENVALPLEVRGLSGLQIQRRVRAVLRSLELEHKTACACATLSGGEQQRVAIARAIVVNPKVILADEPTGNLDHDLSVRLMEVFSQFHQFGTTIILATHDRSLLSIPRKAQVLELAGGQLGAAEAAAPYPDEQEGPAC